MMVSTLRNQLRVANRKGGYGAGNGGGNGGSGSPDGPVILPVMGEAEEEGGCHDGSHEEEGGDIHGRFDNKIQGTEKDDMNLRPGDPEILNGLNDLILCKAGDDVAFGADGDDQIIGGKGKDELHGGPGDDILIGGKGQDTLFGDEGDDILNGGKSDDALFGGEGDDILKAGRGNNTADGGAGADTFMLCPEGFVLVSGFEPELDSLELHQVIGGTVDITYVPGTEGSTDTLISYNGVAIAQVIGVSLTAADVTLMNCG